MRRETLLRNLAPFEKELFVRMVGTLLNRQDGHLAIDDELIESRAKDVKIKALSIENLGKGDQ